MIILDVIAVLGQLLGAFWAWDISPVLWPGATYGAWIVVVALVAAGIAVWRYIMLGQLPDLPGEGLHPEPPLQGRPLPGRRKPDEVVLNPHDVLWR